MASRSGRRGNLPPESKELLDGAAMEWDDDDPEEGPAAETNVTKLQPRLQSSQSPTTKAGSISIPEVGVPTATKKTAAAPNNHAVMSPRNVVGNANCDEGCKVCGRDADHANLLLCESCNDEYHIYCLNPPLASVPEGDFFCGEYFVLCFGNMLVDTSSSGRGHLYFSCVVLQIDANA